MRIGLLRTAAVTAIAALAATTLPLTAQAAPAPAADPNALTVLRDQGIGSFATGLSVGPEIGWNAGLTNAQPPSATYYRIWDQKTAWRDINPSRGEFNWDILDARIDKVTNDWHGKPILVLGLTPEWAAANPSAGTGTWGAGSASPPANMDDWSNYVAAVVQRYGGRIGAYEIWNEANLQTFWQGSVDELVEMTKRASAIIGQSAQVLAPSVTTRLPSGGKWTAAYATALGDANAGLIDGWAIHTYPAGNAGPTVQGACTARVEGIDKWQNALAAAVGPDSDFLRKSQWDTEINYGLAGPGANPATDWSDFDGGMLLICTYNDSHWMGIDVTVWYEYTAEPFDLLGVQFTPTTQVVNGAWNAIATNIARDPKNPWIPTIAATDSATDASSSASDSSSTVSQDDEQRSIRLRGKKKKGSSRYTFFVYGDTTGLAGKYLVAMAKTDPANDYVRGGTAWVDEGGTFTWTLATRAKSLWVFFKDPESGVHSNRLKLK